MFKKVQFKIFAIITSILLAVFIAVLASINIIMEAVMQRQSQVILSQIAVGVEYDDKTSTFTFAPADEGKAPEKPGGDVKAPTERDESSSESSSSSEPEPSEEPTSTASEESSESSVSGEQPTEAADPSVPEPPKTEQSVQTEPPQTAPSEAETQPIVPPVTEKPDKPDTPGGHIPGGNEDDSKPPKHQFGEGEGGGWDERPWGYGDEYCYPMPDDYWRQNYGEFPGIYTDEEIQDQNENGILQTSGRPYANILNGYTVLSVPKKSAENEHFREPKEAAPLPKSFASIDFFIIMADKNGKFLAMMNNEELDDEVAQQYISAIMKENASSGMLNNYQFLRSSKPNGTLMVFTDKQAELDMLDQLNRTTVLIGIVTFAILSVLAFFFSKKSIEPIKLAFEKQKQFVSDASHELKTPLTVISANVDVLSGEIGDNKWLDYIKSQTERMNVLVNDLLNLTRLENNTSDFIRLDFNLSQAVTNTALPFECQAFETNKIFEVDVEPGITANGSERHIKQMAAIFIDNALKYSNEGGTVRVTLKKQGDKSVFSVYNTGPGVKAGEEFKIFERFYRSDDSRSRMTGGYGLGLAIAKSIIDKHKFKLNVENHEGESICFNIIM